jgi:hypothetical protein
MLSKLILLTPLLWVASAGAQGLTSGPPPIKMGLWESTINTGMGAGLKAHVCVTPESYQSAFARMPAGCTVSNETRTNTHASADIDCTMSNSHSTGHFDVDFPDPETGHATVTVNMTIQGKAMPMTIKTDSKFIGSDCGSVAPGKPEILR